MLQDDLIKLKNGDLSAFDSFYEATKRKVFFNVFAILKDENLCEDVLQETYVKFLEKVETLDENSNILGYLFVTSKNIALDMLRKRKREVSIEHYENDLDYIEENNLVEYDVVNKMRRLLNNKEFEIVILHVVNSLTHREIAELKHTPLGTITWAYNNALKKLKKGWYSA